MYTLVLLILPMFPKAACVRAPKGWAGAAASLRRDRPDGLRPTLAAAPALVALAVVTATKIWREVLAFVHFGGFLQERWIKHSPHCRQLAELRTTVVPARLRVPEVHGGELPWCVLAAACGLIAA